MVFVKKSAYYYMPIVEVLTQIARESGADLNVNLRLSVTCF